MKAKAAKGIFKNSAPERQDNRTRWTSFNMLSTIRQSHAEQLRPTLSCKHLKNSYFLIRANFSRVIPFYGTRVAAGTPSNGEEYDYINT